MGESNMAVLCRTGSGEVDVFAFGYERNLTLLAYLYCKYYIAVTLMCHGFPCTFECTVVVGSVGIVDEQVTHAVATQVMRVAIWVCSIDDFAVRPQLVYRERSVQYRVQVGVLVWARCECCYELAIYYRARAKVVRCGIGELTLYNRTGAAHP